MCYLYKMNNTYINIDKPAKLIVKDKVLNIIQDKTIKVPFEDITVIILNNYEIMISKNVFEYISAYKISLIITDQKQQPTGIFMPLTGNVQQAQIIIKQSNLKQTLKGNLWKTIIKAKITNQNLVLEYQGINSLKFKKYIAQVQYNDNTGIEAQSAKFYFSLLFGDNFRREQKGTEDVLNIYLNYGYSIIRSMVARSIVATGLHPSLGIWHHNQYDPMPLASDLMEPLRPFIDYMVIKYIKNKNIKELKFNKDFKEYISRIINQTTLIQDKAQILDNAIPIYISSIKNVIIEKEKPFIHLPRIKE
jgi:CRISPR-associated protein Cas1